MLAANMGVIAGIFFLAIEINQNNELLSAESRANRAMVKISAFDLAATNIDQANAAIKESNNEELSELEIRILQANARAAFARWEYAFGEY